MDTDDNARHPSVRRYAYASPAAERAFKSLPADVRATFGFDLWLVQRGEVPGSSKTLRGFGSADVRELIEDDEAGTYRAVYTIRFQDAVYILHAFKKKSKTGIATDRQTIDLIRQCLKEAEGHHRSHSAEREEERL